MSPGWSAGSPGCASGSAAQNPAPQCGLLPSSGARTTNDSTSVIFMVGKSLPGRSPHAELLARPFAQRRFVDVGAESRCLRHPEVAVLDAEGRLLERFTERVSP